MKTVWTFDIGNSHPHVGKFVAGKLIKVVPFKKAIFGKNDLLLASVVGSKKINKKIKRPAQDRGLKTFLGMPVKYERSLGEDRLLIARYLFDLYPKKKLIVIDAGTFTTVDAIDAKGFCGGFILPGKSLLEECYQKGEKLKKVKFDYVKSKKVGMWPTSTPQALSSAIKNIQGEFINALLKKHPKHQVILTGGNTNFYKTLIPKKRTLQADPHLIHQALYHTGVILCSS